MVAIQSALAQHKRVFVDVTADWCITCKVNKYSVLREDVQAALYGLIAGCCGALRGRLDAAVRCHYRFSENALAVAVPFNQVYGWRGNVRTLLTRDAVQKR